MKDICRRKNLRNMNRWEKVQKKVYPMLVSAKGNEDLKEMYFYQGIFRCAEMFQEIVGKSLTEQAGIWYCDEMQNPVEEIECCLEGVEIPESNM